jgi:TetR/AcrR family transcriptional regulator, cholesterol catabolism regulator
VTKAALYYYVKDKEDLLFRIYQHTLELALASVEAIVQSEQSPATKVRALIDNQVRLITSRPELFTVYFNEKAHLSAEHNEAATRLERQIVQLIALVLREGIEALAFQDVDPTAAAFAVLGASSWVYRWYRKGGRLSVDEVSILLHRVILSGLELMWLNLLARRCSGSLLTRVKQNCRDRWHGPVQANPAGVARQEVGARATTRSNSA